MKNLLWLFCLLSLSVNAQFGSNVRLDPDQDPDSIHFLLNRAQGALADRGIFRTVSEVVTILEPYLGGIDTAYINSGDSLVIVGFDGDTVFFQGGGLGGDDDWRKMSDHSTPGIYDWVYHADTVSILIDSITNNGWTGMLNIEGRIHQRYPNDGSNNIAIGLLAGNAFVQSTDNTIAIGDSCMYSGSSGGKNIGIGRGSMFSNGGVFNTAIGFETLRGGSGSSFGSSGQSTALGYQTGRGSTSSSINNTLIGAKAGFTNSAGDNNLMLGFEAGRLATGSRNIFIGSEAGENETGSDLLYIDNSNTSSPLIYGNFSTNVLTINGTISASNLSGTNTGDQDLSGYSLLGHTHSFSSLTGIPTTLAGYGLTSDFETQGDARWSLLGHTHAFGDLTSIPTTVAGYGITDFNTLGDARWIQLTQSFSGDITGLYSNLQIGTGAVGTNEIATDGVDASEIVANAVGSSELAASGVSGTSCTNCNLTYDEDGRITIASNGSGGSAPKYKTGITVDGGGEVLTTGVKGRTQLETSGTISGVTVLADASGSIEFEIKKSTFSGFPGSLASIVGSNAPELAAAQKIEVTLDGAWTTTVTAGDILEFSVVGTPATITQATLIIFIQP
jgi:hypothetical protein